MADDDSSSVASVGFLNAEEKKQLGDELELAEEFMGLVGGSPAKKKSKVDDEANQSGGKKDEKELKKKGNGGKDASKGKIDGKKETKKAAATRKNGGEKAGKKKADGKKKAKKDDADSGWEPDWESEDSDDSEEEEEVEFSDGKDGDDEQGDDDDSEADGKKKEGKFDWVFKSNRIIQTFGQCEKCIQLQKGLDPVVVQKSSGLFVKLIQCKKCFAANCKIRHCQEGFLERGKSFTFFEEADDYKAAVTTYVKAIGQCEYCRTKMARLNPEKMVEKIGKSHIALLLTQCSTCVGRNKQLQRWYWDAFSSMFKKGNKKNGGGARKNRKRKSVDDDDEEDQDEDFDDGPSASKKRGAGGAKKRKGKNKENEMGDDEDEPTPKKARKMKK